MFVLHYVMVAREGQAEALESALIALAAAVRALEGAIAVELLRDNADENRYIFVEKWADEAAHATAGKQLPKSVFAPVMAALSQPPHSSRLGMIESL